MIRFLCFAIGLIVGYTINAYILDTHTIYPNINDEVSKMYIDDNGVCYKYYRKELN